MCPTPRRRVRTQNLRLHGTVHTKRFHEHTSGPCPAAGSTSNSRPALFEAERPSTRSSIRSDDKIGNNDKEGERRVANPVYPTALVVQPRVTRLKIIAGLRVADWFTLVGLKSLSSPATPFGVSMIISFRRYRWRRESAGHAAQSQAFDGPLNPDPKLGTCETFFNSSADDQYSYPSERPVKARRTNPAANKISPPV